MANGQANSQDALSRFRAAVLCDAALQNELQAFDDIEAFIAAALPRAQTLGLDIGEEELRAALRPDPIGLGRWSDAPATSAVPQRDWLPVNIVPGQDGLLVDWAYFGDRPLKEPFFEDSVRVAMRRPLNRLARHRTRLADLAQAVAAQDVLAPSGFIFHMSRCGSTLVSQMLAADPAHVMISEASPLDLAVRLDFGAGGAPAHAALLVAMVHALGRRRAPQQRRLFVKLDSWHSMALPLIRQAFPDVPWIFMYREPAEVLGSQMVERGMQTLPEFLPPALFGLTWEEGQDSDAYCAQLLSRTCEAVLEPYAQGGGLLVNYNELPQALWSRILPHFGVAPDARARAAMAGAAQFDAKTPSLPFSGSSNAKQQVMTDALCALAEHHMGDVHRRLEALRRASLIANVPAL